MDFVNGGIQRVPDHHVPKDLRAVIKNGSKEWPGMSKEERKFLQRIKEMKFNDQIELNQDNYFDSYKFSLYVEEIQNELNLRDYDMFNQIIYKTYNEGVEGFKIYVEGFVEEISNAVVNNKLKITDVITKQSYVFIIKIVWTRSIFVIPDPMAWIKKDSSEILQHSIELLKDYRPSKTYNIEFILNTYPYRCCHYALNLMRRFQLTSCMFPTIPISTSLKYSKNSIDWFNKNPEQCQAVIKILNQSSQGLPYILYGPPGTGKTSTIIEAICQAHNDNTSSGKILVCTPSNETADNMVKRLFQYIPKTDFKHIHRMYSFAKDPKKIDKEILPYSNCNKRILEDGKIEYEIVMFPILCLPKIIICTLCTSTRLLLMNMFGKYFSYVFIDEAGQAIEPDAIIPFTLLSSSKPEHIGRFNGQIVLAGDPQQLGPVIFSPIAEKILGKSILERLLEFEPYKRDCKNQYNSNYITKLVQNYRSHPSLILISNELFYDNELIACVDASKLKALKWDGLPNQEFPMIFHEVYGKEKRSFSPSSYNEAEIDTVLNYVDKLVGKKIGSAKIKPQDIGIVTPFTAQKVKLKAQLKEIGLESIEVGTVQLFQGKEKEVIIVTTVRSKVFQRKNKQCIGFLSDRKRFNVAITRAKSLLIVIGHPKALEVDEYWRYLINYCKSNGSYIGDSNINHDNTKDLRKKKRRRRRRTRRKNKKKQPIMQQLDSTMKPLQCIQYNEFENKLNTNVKLEQHEKINCERLNGMKTLCIQDDVERTSEDQQYKEIEIDRNSLLSHPQVFKRNITSEKKTVAENLIINFSTTQNNDSVNVFHSRKISPLQVIKKNWENFKKYFQ